MSLAKFNIFILLFLIFSGAIFSNSSFFIWNENDLFFGTIYLSHFYIFFLFLFTIFSYFLNNKIVINAIFLFFLLILFSISLSFLLNLNISASKNYIPLFCLILFYISIYLGSIIFDDKDKIDFFIKILFYFLILHTLFCFYEIIKWILNNGFVYSTTFEFLRPKGLATSPVESTLFLAMGVYISSIVTKKRFSVIFKYIFIVLLLLTFSRLGIILATIILTHELTKFFFDRKISQNYKILFTIFMLLFLSFFTLAEYLYLFNKKDIFFIERINSILNVNLNLQRIQIYEKLTSDILLNMKQMLFGNGFQDFHYIVPTNYTYDTYGNMTKTGDSFIINNPHSSYLSIMFHHGFF